MKTTQAKQNCTATGPQPLAQAHNCRPGTALVMVVVLTVLLAVIGVLFVMVSRLHEMASSSVHSDRDLDNAVSSLVQIVSWQLADDVPIPGMVGTFGDQPGPNVDPWLAPIQPRVRDFNNPTTPGDYSDDTVLWEHVSDLTGLIGMGILPVTANDLWYANADANDLRPADADGDGVPDSYWVRLERYEPAFARFTVPFITSSRGKPIYAALRIVDNCGMLNLNTASYIPDPNFWPDLEGRYLSSIDYSRFLRGSDATPAIPADPIAIHKARRWDNFYDLLVHTPAMFHHQALMRFENAGPVYTLFDIADELEIRNRFMLTSPFEARFERHDVANYTLDAGGGIYGALSVPRDASNFAQWAWRVDPNNFDDISGAFVDPGVTADYRFKYDRRHVCTFYSFDRPLRMGRYAPLDGLSNPVPEPIFPPDPVAVTTNFGVWDPAVQAYNYNNTQTRLQILKLLYAFRAYFIERYRYSGDDYKKAARRACQFVANMIDYVDDTNPASQGPFFDPVYGSQENQNPTWINREIVRQLIIEASDYLSGGQNIIDVDLLPQFEFGIGLDDPDETVYGYERQPFISKIARYQNTDTGTVYYAIELCNPYELDIHLEGWRIKVDDYEYTFTAADSVLVPAATVAATRHLGKLVLTDSTGIFAGGPAPVHFELPGFGTGSARIGLDDVIQLQRPDPTDPSAAEFITVDQTEPDQATWVASPMTPPARWRLSRRDDTKWRFANMTLYENTETSQSVLVALGGQNGITLNGRGFQMPVANNNKPIGTLLDFSRVLLVGNERDPNGVDLKPVTEHIASAAAAPSRGEKDVRMDVLPRQPMPFPGIPRITPIDYVCFIGRPEGSLPGRININTAPMEVIRAAIRDHADLDPDYDTLARNIVSSRHSGGLPIPYRRITDLLDTVRDIGFDQFAADPVDNVGDPEMTDDFEERDWILSQVANIFTVRSDVFTAHILVRIGRDGPQRRMIAIIDRTNVNRHPLTGRLTAKPRIVALHPVPDPR